MDDIAKQASRGVGACASVIVVLFFIIFYSMALIFPPDADATEKTATVTGAGAELTVKGKVLKLPASKGKTGQEEYLSGMTFSGQCNAEEIRWYITMRWPYAAWSWSGHSRIADSTKALWAAKKVLVTNPRNHKQVVTAICESGPAPWAGSGRSSGNPPSNWTGFLQFDPPGATGRVSGLPPDPINAIGAQTDTVLEYTWADQNAALGPVK